jgi:membrane protein implicated in regulation of membrane protease activity
MRKLCIFIGMIAGSYIGWWLGAKVGITLAFIASSIGSIIGVYLGWRINRDYLG